MIVTALAFDFTNGFHDTGNAMAPSIATGALKPKTAVALSAVLNLVGAFLSVAVAATVAKGIVNLGVVEGKALLYIVFAGLVGGILWNLVTWLFGLPSSSSHALFGGLIGAALAALGTSGVEWSGVLWRVVLPALLAPVVAGLGAVGVVVTVGAWAAVEQSSRALYVGGLLAYAASKSGVVGLTKSLAVELGYHGVTVNAICPGPINTAMTEKYDPDKKLAYAKARVPLRRYGDAEEVAQMTLNLCLPASSFVTGAVIPVDGGMTVRHT